jgi:hypothetical protein
MILIRVLEDRKETVYDLGIVSANRLNAPLADNRNRMSWKWPGFMCLLLLQNAAIACYQLLKASVSGVLFPGIEGLAIPVVASILLLCLSRTPRNIRVAVFVVGSLATAVVPFFHLRQVYIASIATFGVPLVWLSFSVAGQVARKRAKQGLE